MCVPGMLAALVALVALGAAPGRGLAQPASVQAQSLFDEGRRLMKAGKIAEACSSFEASQKLDPAVTTLLNLADCREQNQQLATAWGVFVDANRLARSGGNDKLAKVATSHARKLEPRLSRLTIAVPPDRQIAGLEVLRGKDPVIAASWNHALPVDGGSYTITARAPGHEPWSVVRSIKVEGDAQTIEIPRLAELKVAAPPPAAPPPKEPPPTVAHGPAEAPRNEPKSQPKTDRPASGATGGTAPTEHRPGPPAVATGGGAPGESSSLAPGPEAPGPNGRPEAARSYTMPLALGGGAVALGGAALGFHLWGNSLYKKAQDDQRAGNQAQQDAHYHAANTRRYVAEGLVGAAVGCAGAAVYFYVRGRGERSPAVAVTPVVSPELAGLAVVGGW